MWASSPVHFVGNNKKNYEETDDRIDTFASLHLDGATIG
jgi:hypothetical protein